jgi:hypothetical protein
MQPPDAAPPGQRPPYEAAGTPSSSGLWPSGGGDAASPSLSGGGGKRGERVAWSPAEHAAFLTGLSAHGRDWRAISRLIGPTRSLAQVRRGPWVVGAGGGAIHQHAGGADGECGAAGVFWLWRVYLARQRAAAEPRLACAHRLPKARTATGPVSLRGRMGWVGCAPGRERRPCLTPLHAGGRADA